ncbi:SRPBCC family protein [Demequina sp. NBRC 110054]|uniref:SRPBCC family protein n=1 Tax=Demequina sp. NBRC 110054 TaxID=1570343 RepID=UPI000A068138|nr:SRPBCC family protein [Demequina sp. NBRC 110054]
MAKDEWSVDVSVDIKAPVATVWEILTDLDGAPDVMTGILAIERLGGPDGYEVGTRWRETRKMFGKEATEDMEVASVVAPRETTVVAHSHGADYVSGFTVEELPGGTRLTMRFTGSPSDDASGFSRFMAKVTAPLGASATRKAMQTDLDEIKAVAEARADG